MTEVPEHLLRRSKERKAQMTGEGADQAASEAAPAGGGAVEPAAPTAAASAGRSGGGAPATPAAPAYVGPPQPPPKRPRLPLWAMPVVAALPFWAMLYSGAFGERHVEATGIMAEGEALYAGQGCGGCHGASGGGGVGPAMDGVEVTFPDFADHVEWIRTGSAAFRGQPYGATGKIATGGMPGFDLEESELIAVACYERVVLGGAETPPECEEGADPDAGEGGDDGHGDGGEGTDTATGESGTPDGETDTNEGETGTDTAGGENTGSESEG